MFVFCHRKFSGVKWLILDSESMFVYISVCLVISLYICIWLGNVYICVCICGYIYAI